MRRTDLLDTSPRAHRQMVEVLRAMTPSQKAQMVLDRIDLGRAMQEQAKKRQADLDLEEEQT